MRKQPRALALALCLAVLFSMLPAGAFAQNGGDEPLPRENTLETAVDITGEYLYNGKPDENGQKIEDDYLIKGEDQLYLDFTFSINQVQIEEIIAEEEPVYSIPVPKGLRISGRGSEELQVDLEEGESSFVFAILSWDSDGAEIAFNTENLKKYLDAGYAEITKAYFYFVCQFDKENAIPEGEENNRYQIEFVTNETVTVGLDKDEIREQEGKLEKSVAQDENDPSLLTWTITYTPYQNTEKTGFEIHDTLGKGMEPDFTVEEDGSVSGGVSVMREKEDISGCSVVYDQESRTLIIRNMGEAEENWTQPVTITYRTRIDESLLLPSTGGEMFGSGDPITREQFAVMLHRYAQHAGYDTAQGGMAIREYADYDEISGYALEAMAWANGNGLINGHDDGTLEPGGTTTRAQAASILMRFDQNVVEK